MVEEKIERREDQKESNCKKKYGLWKSKDAWKLTQEKKNIRYTDTVKGEKSLAYQGKCSVKKFFTKLIEKNITKRKTNY